MIAAVSEVRRQFGEDIVKEVKKKRESIRDDKQ